MTREDVVLCLKGIKKLGNDFFTPRSTKDFNESLDIAISEFEKQPSDDCVSRERVLEELEACVSTQYMYDENNGLTYICYEDAVDWVEKLPSVTPTSKWIPTLVRMPEEGKDVLIDVEEGGEHTLHVTHVVDVNYWVRLGRDVNVVAWMPLPEPYKAESEESIGKTN